MSILRRYPLTSFFILAYAITWAGIPFGWFFTFGPLLAALIVVALTQGKAGLREWGSRLIRWRVRWVWYVLAITVPLAVLAAALSINLSLGAGPASLAQLAPGSIVLIFAVRLINPSDGPLGEEPGWRGFAQPGLQRRHSPLVATSILGLLVAGWHLPLWLMPQFGATPVIIISDFLGTVAVTFWYAWLFNHSGGSVLLTLISHDVEGVIHPQLFWTDPAVAERVTLIYAAAWCAVAIAVVVFDRRHWRRVDGAASPSPAKGSRVEDADHDDNAITPARYEPTS
jgi:membrane protease YdiL (CAAX protease family)